MANRSPIPFLAAGALLALCQPIGCNAVLDIEEARPKQTGAAGGSSSGTFSPSPTPYAVSGTCIDPPSSACSDCITTSCPAGAQGDPQAECLKNTSCRSYMLGYSTCIGKACSAPVTNCFEPMFGLNSPVPGCMLNCGEQCSGSPIFSTCQLYCGCMLANCSAKFANMADCLTACTALKPETVNCRWTHCEVAPAQPTIQHCDHAVGGLTVCPDSATVVRSAKECPDRSLKSFYCEQPADCCSDDCDTGRRLCN